MKITENIRLALAALIANKMRAALTMLGIMIGVAAVITLLALGDGVTRFIADQFVGLGTNLVFILPAEDPDRPRVRLTIRDAEALADPARVPDALAVAPVLFSFSEIQYGGEIYSTQLQGSTPELGPLRGYEPVRGRFISEADYNGRSRVVVLGPAIIDAIFPEGVDPLGANVKVRGINFRVIGILGSKGGGAFGNEDDLAIIPLSTMQERLLQRRDQNGEFIVNVILMQAVNQSGVDNVVIDASDTLRQMHNIAFRDQDDFQVLTQADFLSAFGEVTGVLTIFLGAIAGISLLVGGIGIMNIMLVSVTERTREIGLRKAVGAKKRDILSQFLTEAMILAVLGGLLGVGLGALGAAIIHWQVPDLDTSVAIDSVLLAVTFSAAVGLFFGIYPAYRAASLHPIDALRFE